LTQVAGKRFFTPKELVERWEGRISVRTMANWRSQSNGPRYVKIGGRIMYKIEDVVSWENSRTVGGTSEYQAA
jgi:predicted heme/steroid binding protein